jgi:hypothetical protein
MRSRAGEEGEPLSTPVQSLSSFRARSSRSHWRASDLFHAVYSPHEETVRWFISLGSNVAPRHALAYHTVLNRWWIEEFQQPILSSVLARRASRRVVFLGAEGKKVWAVGRGYLERHRSGHRLDGRHGRLGRRRQSDGRLGVLPDRPDGPAGPRSSRAGAIRKRGRFTRTRRRGCG